MRIFANPWDKDSLNNAYDRFIEPGDRYPVVPYSDKHELRTAVASRPVVILGLLIWQYVELCHPQLVKRMVEIVEKRLYV